MNFAFYMVESEYCDFLRENDPYVPYTRDEKSKRPFVGIVLLVNNFNYYAPLTSPKKKHLTMKNQIDFIKIDGGRLGAVNLNNMIPVPESCLIKVETRVMDSDTKAAANYKNLLSNQLSWCNSHRDLILSRACKLYRTIVNGRGWPELSSRCCDFRLDETKCAEYETARVL